jgi:hypothetical protein
MRLLSSCHVLSGLLLVACSAQGTRKDAATDSALSDAISGAMPQPAPAAVTDSEWTPLFDGGSTAAWRGFKQPDFPAGWQVVDGALTRMAPAGDIITVAEFGDFELQLEYRVDKGANSGIMYRVTEADSNTYRTGPEYQILDDERHPDAKDPTHRVGALYGLYAPENKPAAPAEQWNTARIIVRGSTVEHWLNGARIVSADMASPEFAAKVAASKFQYWPGFAKAPRGHIALQDHGDRVAYRNIRIRSL